MSGWTVTHTDDTHRYVWDGPEPAEITLERITESKSRGITAEVTVTTPLHDIGRIIGPVNLNLLSDRSQKMLANTLSDTTDIISWQRYLADAASDAITWLREGDPPTKADLATSYRTTWALEPYCETDGYTVVFARGGSGKSLLAATMALSVATGVDLIGAPTVTGPVLYCDWESSADVLDWRLARLARPLGITDAPVYYRREAGPLASKTRALARHINRLGVVLLVVDSKGLATTGAPESAEGILELARALRTLDTPTILIDHVSKGAIKGDDPNMAYGSQYVEAAARQAWAVGSEATTGGISLRLSNTKSNNGRKHPAVGVTFLFDDDEIHITTSDAPVRPRTPTVKADTQATGPKGASTEDRIIELMTVNPGHYTTADLATILDIDPDTVRKAVNRSDRLVVEGTTKAVVDTGQEALPDPF